MSVRRPIKSGSFGGHLSELVKHFPHEPPARTPTKRIDKEILKEKLDIHALLFERAWQLERNTGQFRDLLRNSDPHKVRR